MRLLMCKGAWVATIIVAAGCVERPIEGTTGPGGGIIPDVSDGSPPIATPIRVSGVHPEPNVDVTIEVAMEKYAKGNSAATFEPVAAAKSAAIADPSADGTNWYRWTADVTIVNPTAWHRGVSGGWVAHTRARTTFAGNQVILGTPEQPYSQPVCDAYKANNNAFGPTYASFLALGCAQPGLDSVLLSEVRTASYDDDCFYENKACCTVGTDCDLNLVCTNGWCQRPGSTAPPGKSTVGGVAPATAPSPGKVCTPGETKEATAGTPPDAGCESGFTVMGYVTCLSNGTWGTSPSYYECNSIVGDPSASSKKCYCNGAGDACGAGTASNGKGIDSTWICNGDTMRCIPGTCCRDTMSSAGVSLGMRCWGTPSKKCWTPADLTPETTCTSTNLTVPDPSSPSFGGFTATGGTTVVTNSGGGGAGGRS